MKRIATLFFSLLAVATLLHGQLLINHLNTDITTLTWDEINLAKETLHIAYGHTSHGSQVTDGMTGLVGFANGGGKGIDLPNDFFAWNDGGTDDALDLEDYAMGGDVGSFPAWRDNTLSFLGTVDPTTGRGTNNPDVNVIMWSWCGQAAGYSESQMISDYLTPMNLLEGVYFGVKFIYMTCHLDGTGLTGNLHLRNEQIRAFCNANNKILFDFTDIECYDPDGTYYGDKHPTDGCTYDANGNGTTSETGDPDLPVEGSGDKNWAVDYQNSHDEDVEWYNCGAAHTQPLNANQKAYAVWRMFAEIAKIISLESVPTNLTVSDTIIVSTLESACFDATDTLTITGEIDTVEFQSGTLVDLIAGKSIFLKPGFHAFEGSTTHAFITTNDQYCFSTPEILAPDVSEKSATVNLSLPKKEKLDQEKTVKVYPNPNNGQFSLEMINIESGATVCIYNMLGDRIYQFNATNGSSMKINLPEIQKGIYIIRVIDLNNRAIKMIVTD